MAFNKLLFLRWKPTMGIHPLLLVLSWLISSRAKRLAWTTPDGRTLLKASVAHLQSCVFCLNFGGILSEISVISSDFCVCVYLSEFVVYLWCIFSDISGHIGLRKTTRETIRYTTVTFHVSFIYCLIAIWFAYPFVLMVYRILVCDSQAPCHQYPYLTQII